MASLAQLPRSARGALLRRRRPSKQHRYMAFLSYSHQDSDAADWLHEELEEFKVPSRLVGKLTDQGVVPKKLSPIFRDRQELAASPDLGEEIEEAIENSRFLIVLCSPAAAKSRWIGEEIACFKRLHGEDRILAAILEGEPVASEIAGREHEECFPAELRFHFDSRGRPTAQRAEPIAADLREEGEYEKAREVLEEAGLARGGMGMGQSTMQGKRAAIQEAVEAADYGAFRNAIKKYFPNIPLIRCWNHFWKSTERWVKTNKKMSQDDVGFYCESLRELFLQPTKQLFDEQLTNKIHGYTKIKSR